MADTTTIAYYAYPGDALLAAITATQTRMSSDYNSQGPWNWTGYTMSYLDDAVANAQGWQCRVGQPNAGIVYKLFLLGTKSGGLYPFHLNNCGALGNAVNIAAPRGTYHVVDYDLLANWMDGQWWPAVQAWFAGACDATVGATSAYAVTDGQTNQRLRVYTATLSRAQSPRLTALWDLTFGAYNALSNLPVPSNPGGPVTRPSTGGLPGSPPTQMPGDTYTAAALLQGIEDVKSAIQAFSTMVHDNFLTPATSAAQSLKDAASQDLDVSLNNGEVIYSVRSKEIVTP